MGIQRSWVLGTEQYNKASDAVSTAPAAAVVAAVVASLEQHEWERGCSQLCVVCPDHLAHQTPHECPLQTCMVPDTLLGECDHA
jgi:hypothetical protein